ncbi:DUF2157 domain-containing protein [Massilia sp. CCM 8733]|uniref:DUF2157 domain-containing protein n=1 Tax=Massilia mucilaginosa TaxID=2609282 RepID=A0ABX0P5B7_9BURK|nr:DUF2157 domain-containing protein [Massilia mucilaginosa]NHZ93911.1 DUF2157 domain-containing protein [Massilia mucilaginosa]
MDIGLSLLEISEAHRLKSAQHKQLRKLSGLDDPPANLTGFSRVLLAIMAASLIGLGIIFWIAANWDWLGRAGRFILLQGVTAVMCIGACALPRARVPLGLLALLSIGAVFAYFGQTYQTGADPWQLFALWAVLGLPLCLSIRHDALWTPWALIAMTAISLWFHANTGRRWDLREGDLLYQATVCIAMFSLTAMLSPVCARWTGAGLLSMRVCVVLAVLSTTTIGIEALFDNAINGQYWLAVILLGLAAAAFTSRRLFDLFALSTIALASNVLLVGLFAHIQHRIFGSWSEVQLFFTGLAAAGLLAATVSLILKLAARAQANGGVQ